MATTKYRIRKSATGNGGKIQIEFHYGKGNRFRYGTGLTIQSLKNWDSNKMRIKNVIGEKYKTEVNNELNKLQTGIENHYTKLALTEKSVVNNDVLKEYCEVFFNRNKPKSEDDILLSFLDFFSWFINHYKTHPSPSTGKPLGSGTRRTYTNAYNIFKRFNDEEYNIDYDQITLTFYDDFLNWGYGQNYSSNYVGTQIKILKTILNSATEKKFNKNLDYSTRYFRKPSELIDNIFLTQSEVERISNADLSSFKGKIENGVRITRQMLEKSRDLFLIGCSTGLRVSDFNNLNESHLFEDSDGTMFFRLSMKKGDKPITIPINSMVRKILKRNGGTTPSRIPDQFINYSIKIIGEIAGVDESTCKTITKGGKKDTTTAPKYKFITNHTARRSFCTNGYLSGIPTIDIMAISGHTQERTFYNYIKVNDLQKAQKISKYKFFQ